MADLRRIGGEGEKKIIFPVFFVVMLRTFCILADEALYSITVVLTTIIDNIGVS